MREKLLKTILNGKLMDRGIETKNVISDAKGRSPIAEW